MRAGLGCTSVQITLEYSGANATVVLIWMCGVHSLEVECSHIHLVIRERQTALGDGREAEQRKLNWKKVEDVALPPE